jgi:hypothetical protein
MDPKTPVRTQDESNHQKQPESIVRWKKGNKMYTNVSSTPSDSSNSPPVEDGSTTPPLQEDEAIIGIQSEDGINNGGNRHQTTLHGLMSTFRRGKAQLHTLIPTPSPPILVSQPGSGSGYSPLLFASNPPSSVSSSFQLLPLPPSSFSQTQLPSHSHLSHTLETLHPPPLPFTSLDTLHPPPLPSTSHLRFRPQQQVPSSISSTSSTPSSSQVSLPSYPYLPPYALPPSSLAQSQTHVASLSVSQSSSPQSSSPDSPSDSQISLPPYATGGREGVLPHFPFPSHLNASTSSYSDDHPHPLDTASFYTEDEGPTTTGGLGDANEMYHLFPARVRNQVSSGFILRAGGSGGVKAKLGGGKEGGGETGSPSTGRERAESIWADSGDTGIWRGNGMEGARVMLVDGDGPENTRWFESLRAADKQIKKLNRRKKPFWIDVRDISSEDIKLLETGNGILLLVVVLVVIVHSSFDHAYHSTSFPHLLFPF